MKTLLNPVLFGALTLAARAAIVVPGADGSDGVLNITVNTEIDLSQAPTGTWDQNNAANAGKGVYDPAKWAVVFKYSSVNVAAGATVTFKNHASRAPVVWLVNGDVTIGGTVSLDGKGGGAVNPPSPALTESGPGGFRGGSPSVAPDIIASKGFGPGGGGHYAGGSYASEGKSPSGGPKIFVKYGNPSLIPLLGGSGGGGNPGYSGGAGGGAILVAATGQFLCAGSMTARGGNGSGQQSGAGSGGGIRVVAESISGVGNILAGGGLEGYGNIGGHGRIRIERVVTSGSLQLVPDPSVVPMTLGQTALLWPPTGAPEVSIFSIGNASAPVDPRASFGSFGADVALPQSPSIQVVVETKNVEDNSIVTIRGTARSEFISTNLDVTLTTASIQNVVSTNPLVIRWVATLPVNSGYSALQAHVVRP